MANITRRDAYRPADAFNDVRYSDFYMNLDPHPDSKQLVRYVDSDAVKSSIRNLVLTNKYERLFQPNIGSNLRAYLFELISPETEFLIKKSITETIENYEPRAQLIDVVVSGQIDDNAYTVSIYFYVNNNPNAQALNFTLNRLR
jgi:phage baseplate assembly protein W